MVFAAGALAVPNIQRALAGMQLYYAGEMLAALLLFAIVFAVVAAIILILFLLDRGLDYAFTWTKLCFAHVALRLHRGWAQVGKFGRKQFHRSEQPANPTVR